LASFLVSESTFFSDLTADLGATSFSSILFFWMRDCIFWVNCPGAYCSLLSYGFFIFFSNWSFDSDLEIVSVLWCLCLCSCFLCFFSRDDASCYFLSSFSFSSFSSFSRCLFSASSWFFFISSSCSFFFRASAFFFSADFLSLLAASCSASSSSLLSESEPDSDSAFASFYFEVYSFLSLSIFLFVFFVVFLDSVSLTLIFTLVLMLTPASFFELDFF